MSIPIFSLCGEADRNCAYARHGNNLNSDEWIKKMYIYAMEYYSAIKKNEIMPLAATWMDLEMIILSEVNQRKTNVI